MLFSEECAVTGCASTHSFPFQFLFTWDVEPLSRGTRSDDDTFGIDSVLIIHRDFKRTFIKSDFRNKSISAIGTKTLRLLPKILHHTGPEYAFRIPREEIGRASCRRSARRSAGEGSDSSIIEE